MDYCPLLCAPTHPCDPQLTPPCLCAPPLQVEKSLIQLVLPMTNDLARLIAAGGGGGGGGGGRDYPQCDATVSTNQHQLKSCCHEMWWRMAGSLSGFWRTNHHEPRPPLNLPLPSASPSPKPRPPLNLVLP